MKCFDHLLDDFVAAMKQGNLIIETEEQRRIFRVLMGEAEKRGVLNGLAEYGERSTRSFASAIHQNALT